jgi:hypothetical protein
MEAMIAALHRLIDAILRPARPSARSTHDRHHQTVEVHSPCKPMFHDVTAEAEEAVSDPVSGWGRSRSTRSTRRAA